MQKYLNYLLFLILYILSMKKHWCEKNRIYYVVNDSKIILYFKIGEIIDPN